MTNEPTYDFGGSDGIGESVIDYVPTSGEDPKAGLSPVVGVNFPFGRWIIFGGHRARESFCRILIGRDGEILSDKLLFKYRPSKWHSSGSAEHQQERQSRIRAVYRFSAELASQEARKIGSDAHKLAHQLAHEAARAANLSTHDILQNMPEAFLFRTERHRLRDVITAQVLALTGITAENLTQLKQTGCSYLSVPKFNKAARAIVKGFPELGLGTGDSDTSADVWELIGTEKQEAPKLHDPETVEQAALWLRKVIKEYRIYSPFDPNDTTSFAYGFGGLDEALIGKSEFTN